ncbi:bile acid:sodium symporter family protein [Thermodesulfobacteriota bacterium]
MSRNDIIMLVVTFTSGGAALLFPAPGELLHPHLTYFIMIILFLSFLRIDFRALVDTSSRSLTHLGILVVFKLLLVPIGLYFATLLVLPDYAVPTLLLSGISTGVMAPFMAVLVSADGAKAFRMVIVTSVLVPFTLPPLVKLLVGAQMEIPLAGMFQILAAVIFIPMGAVLILRRFAPQIPERIAPFQFSISMVFLAAINLGVFSHYSDFFVQNPGRLLVCMGVAYVLAVIYYSIGFLLTPGGTREERLAAGLSFAIMNNVVVIVFASRFFGPLAPTLAAMYMFPFYTMIVPVKLLANLLPDSQLEKACDQ